MSIAPSSELLDLLRHWFARIVQPIVAWHNEACPSSDATQQLLNSSTMLIAMDSMHAAGIPMTPAVRRARETMKIERHDFSTAVDRFTRVVVSLTTGMQPPTLATLEAVSAKAVSQWREASSGNDVDGDEYPFIMWDLFRHQLSALFTESVALILRKLSASSDEDDNSKVRRIEGFLMSSLAECLEDLARVVQQQMASMKRCGRNFHQEMQVFQQLHIDESAVAERLARSVADELRDVSGTVAKDVVAALGLDVQDAINRSNRKVISSSRPSSSCGSSSSSMRISARPTSAASGRSSSVSQGLVDPRTPQGFSFRHLPPDPYKQQWIAKRTRTVESFHVAAQAAVASCVAVAEKLAEISQTSVSKVGRRRGLRAALIAARDSQADGMKAVRRTLQKLEHASDNAVLCADALGDEWVRHRREETAAAQLTKAAANLSDDLFLDPQESSEQHQHHDDGPRSLASRMCREQSAEPHRQPIILPKATVVVSQVKPTENTEVGDGRTSRPKSSWDRHARSKVDQALQTSAMQLSSEADILAAISEQPRSAFPAKNGGTAESSGAMIAQHLIREARSVASCLSEESRLDALRFGMSWRRSRRGGGGGGGKEMDRPDHASLLFDGLQYARLEKAVQVVSPGRIRKMRPMDVSLCESTAKRENEFDKILNPSWHLGKSRFR